MRAYLALLAGDSLRRWRSLLFPVLAFFLPLQKVILPRSNLPLWNFHILAKAIKMLELQACAEFPHPVHLLLFNTDKSQTMLNMWKIVFNSLSQEIDYIVLCFLSLHLATREQIIPTKIVSKQLRSSKIFRAKETVADEGFAPHHPSLQATPKLQYKKKINLKAEGKWRRQQVLHRNRRTYCTTVTSQCSMESPGQRFPGGF